MASIELTDDELAGAKPSAPKPPVQLSDDEVAGAVPTAGNPGSPTPSSDPLARPGPPKGADGLVSVDPNQLGKDEDHPALAAAGNSILHPVDTLTNPAKRRELERGVGGAIKSGTFGAVDPAAIAGKLDPAFAARASQDAAEAPGYQELGGAAGAALPTPASVLGGMAAKKAVEVASPYVSAGIKKVADAAQARRLSRGAEAVAEGAGKKATAGLKEVAPGLQQELSEDPTLLKATEAKGDDKLATSAQKLMSDGVAETDRIYAQAGLPKPVVRAAAKAASTASEDSGPIISAPKEWHDASVGPDNPTADAQVRASLLSRAAKLPPGSPEREELMNEATNLRDNPAPEPTTVDATHEAVPSAVSEEPTAKHALPGAPATKPTLGHAYLDDLDRRIAKLATGTDSEVMASQKLQAIKDRAAHLGEKESIPQELRAHQSDHQRASYGKAMAGDVEGNANLIAHAEASKAAGDAVLKHTLGMGYEEAKAVAASDPQSLAAQLFRANQKISIANRIQAAIKARGGVDKSKTLLHEMATARHMGALGGAGLLGHYGGVPGKAIGGAIIAHEVGKAALPHVAAAVDPILAGLRIQPASPAVAEMAKKLVSMGTKAAIVDGIVARMNSQQQAPDAR